jgi:hypothetical protein
MEHNYVWGLIQTKPSERGQIDGTNLGVFAPVTKSRDQGNSCIVIGGEELAGPMPLYTRPQTWSVTNASNGWKYDM